MAYYMDIDGAKWNRYADFKWDQDSSAARFGV